MKKKIEIGDVVIPKFEGLQETFILASGCGRYDGAICVDLDPFTLVSFEGDMLWQSTVEEHRFIPLCKASEEILEKCRKRYKF